MQCWKLSSSFFSVCDRDVLLDWGCGWACRGPCKEPKASATAAVQELFWLQLFDMQGSTRVWHQSIRQSTKASTRKLFPNSLPRYHFASVRNVPLIWSSLAKHDMQPTHTQTMSTHDWCMFFLGIVRSSLLMCGIFIHQALGVQVRLVSGKVDVVFLYNENVEGFGKFQGTLPEARQQHVVMNHSVPIVFSGRTLMFYMVLFVYITHVMYVIVPYHWFFMECIQSAPRGCPLMLETAMYSEEQHTCLSENPLFSRTKT